MNIVVHQLHLLPSRWLWSTLSPGFWRSCSSFCQGWSPFFVRWVPVTHHRHRLEHERPGTPVGSKRCDFQYDFHRFQCPSFRWRRRHGIHDSFISSWVLSRQPPRRSKILRSLNEAGRADGTWLLFCFLQVHFLEAKKRAVSKPTIFMGQSADHIKKIKAQLWPGTASRLRALDAGARGPSGLEPNGGYLKMATFCWKKRKRWWSIMGFLVYFWGTPFSDKPTHCWKMISPFLRRFFSLSVLDP